LKTAPFELGMLLSINNNFLIWMDFNTKYILLDEMISFNEVGI